MIFGEPVPSQNDEGAAAPPPAPEVEGGAPTEAPAVEPASQGAVPQPNEAAKQYLDPEAVGGHLVKIKVAGVEKEVPLADALKGYMREADYTRKTQELSAQARRLNQAEQLVAALEQDPVRTLKQLADAYEIDVDNGLQPQEPDPNRDMLRSLHQEVQALRGQSVQQKIDAEIAQIQEAYGDFDLRSTAAYAVDRGLSLTDAYKTLNFDAVRQGQSAQAKVEENRQRALAAQVVEGGAAVQRGAVSAAKKVPQSFREAYFSAKQEHGM